MAVRLTNRRPALRHMGQDPAGGGHEDTSLPVIDELLDPAGESLSDALRMSFRLLKVFMFVLIAAYFCSGGGCVQPDEQVVVLRFGKIVGEPLGPGFHFSFPYPIDERIAIPVKQPKRLEINLFWIRVKEKDKGKEIDQILAGGSTLDPVADGALITGDKNLIHLLVQVTYTISDAIRYVSNVLDEDALIKSATESSMIAAVAAQEVDSILRGQSANVISAEIKKRLQRLLDRLETGIRVEIVSIESKTPPLQVRDAFSDVQRAESEQLQIIEEARTESTKLLNEAAGAAHKIVFAKIQEYEQARDADEEARAELLRAELVSLLANEATGEAAQLIQLARTYRENVVQEVQAEVQRFQQMLPAYRSDPESLVTALWLETQKDILGNKRIEKYFIDPNGKEIRFRLQPNEMGRRELEEEGIRLKELGR